MEGCGEVMTDTGLPPLLVLPGSFARLTWLLPDKSEASLQTVRSSFSLATILSWKASGSCWKHNTNNLHEFY